MTWLPIVERELRIAARRPATYWFRAGAAVAAMTAALLVSWSMGTNRFVSAAMVAKETFNVLSAMLMVYSLFAGMFQTADCLSSEKRDGTLGLLFLTDLHGYDVVLGKLAACSLNCFYGLVSMLPVLAIPLLAGGVTVGEFWRVVVLLLAGLFFSLGVGMFVSAVARDSRQSLSLSLFLIIFFAGILPAIYAALWQLYRIRSGAALLWPSLGYTLAMAHDSYYSYRDGARAFWGSLATISGIGLSGLIVAAIILPRAWQGKARSGSATSTSLWQKMRFGSGWRRKAIKQLMSANPFYWLTVRDRLPQVAFWLVAAIMGPIWVLLFFSVLKAGPALRAMEPFQLIIAVSIAVNLVFKCLVASEATRRLNDDRRSGALELLLVTPLTEASIVDGQRRALRAQFLLPIILLEFALLLIIWLRGQSGLASLHDEGIFYVVLIGNMLVLFGDFLALRWVGMWAGMRGRNHHRAILAALVRILAVPWLLYFVLGTMGLFNNRSPIPLFASWFALCLLNDLVWALRAREGLRREFRRLASGTADKALIGAVAKGFST